MKTSDFGAKFRKAFVNRRKKTSFKLRSRKGENLEESKILKGVKIADYIMLRNVIKTRGEHKVGKL